ncbi:DUF3748 domain-containing protein [Terrimonas sp.]|uniref:DUF3748 domain-containing protein n=1 Tax=Terrimonas sp. TaxID=1914338 RepID=UPI00197EC7FC|nr:DUF3748 domain-containing protein [Terrimonas sp.]
MNKVFLASAMLCFIFFNCTNAQKEGNMYFNESQLTHDKYGHFLNSTQVFSPDDKWIVYDTRNDDGGIGVTGSIEMVNVETGAIKQLYKTANQTKFGPGVGAATFSPVADTVLFIHGIRNADEKKPYGFARRTAVAIDINKPFDPIFMDGRDITAPFTPGALRGGTHAYTWSGDGQWICFTYNDYIIDQLGKTDSSVKDLRTIAVMAPGKVNVRDDSTMDNNSGEKFAAVVAEVKENPEPGSDEIDKAFDEGWVGKKGYKKSDGTWQNRAIAFQGNVKNNQQQTIAEVFVTDIPDDITKAVPGKPLEGTATTRPGVPQGVIQRRITHTEKGIVGPRHWLKSAADGSKIFFLTKDEKDIVQVFSVSPNGGDIQQISFNEFSVEGPINVSPDDTYIAYIADNSVFITDIKTHQSYRLNAADKNAAPSGAAIWSNDGKMLVFNRKVKDGDGMYYQVFVLKRGYDE